MMMRLFFILLLCSCVSPIEPVSKNIFDGVNLGSISSKQLEVVFVEKGLDGVNAAFYKVSNSLKQKSLKNRGSKLSQSDQEKLVKVVHRARFITEKYDEGNMHYYGFSKLYLEMPGDLTAAINRSDLRPQEKEDMVETLKNTLKKSQ